MPCRAGAPCLRASSPLILLLSCDIACGTLGLGVRPTYCPASTPATVGMGFTSHFPGVPHGQGLFWLVNVSREDMCHLWGEAFKRWCQVLQVHLPLVQMQPPERHHPPNDIVDEGETPAHPHLSVSQAAKVWRVLLLQCNLPDTSSNTEYENGVDTGLFKTSYVCLLCMLCFTTIIIRIN